MTGEKIITVPNMSAGFSVIWGLWALNPFNDMFAINPKLYGPMLYWVPSEAFWGSLFAIAGIAAWVASYYDRSDLAALMLCVAYAFFASLYFIGDYHSPGWALYGYVSFVHFMYWGAYRWKISRS